MLSVEEVAVNTSVPGVLELTVKVAMPLALVVWVADGLIVGVPGPELDKVTSSLGTGMPPESFRVTVMVE